MEKSSGTQPTLFTGNEKDLCRTIFENTAKKDDQITWDQLYELVEDPQGGRDNESKEGKKKMGTWRKKMTDARLRINGDVSKIAGKKIEAIGLVKGETTFVRGIE